MIEPLNFPNAPLHLIRKKELVYVTCLVRKRLVKLTPEEWVRQHMIHYLLTIKKASAGLIAVEKSIRVNGLNRRYDIVVADQAGRCKVLVECKATNVPLSEETVFQLAHYNSVLLADYVVITNGLQIFVAKIEHSTQRILILDELPELTNY